MNNLIDQILTDWAYRVPNGMPDPKNHYHLIHLKESMKHLQVDGEVMDMVMNHLYGKKVITEVATNRKLFIIAGVQECQESNHEQAAARTGREHRANLN